ncbi:hypothetical protein OAL27_02405 [Verrucomicrobiales bacterium]|nr:hypothetical protein [Verrucomicrobiales bacterium]
MTLTSTSRLRARGRYLDFGQSELHHLCMGEITGKHTVYETPWFQLESKEVDDDDEAPFYALNLSDYVGVFAIHSDDRILLVKQYRPAVER